MGRTQTNPNSLKNLKSFKPGQSGNPKGRPKKLPQLDEILAEVLGQENDKGKTVAEGIITAMANKALKGDAKAAALVLDRGYGKVTQPVDADVRLRGKVRIGFSSK